MTLRRLRPFHALGFPGVPQQGFFLAGQGFFRLRRIQILRFLLRRNERSLVIFISSIAGRVPIPFQSHYSSSKYALEAYAESLDMEACGFGLRTVLLEPGDTKTGFTSKWKKFIPSDSPYRSKAEKAIARMEHDEMNGKDPDTVARAALKVASKKNPPVRKPIGIEYSLLMILPRILPQKLVHRILRSMY